jgi:hypothetical protein
MRLGIAPHLSAGGTKYGPNGGGEGDGLLGDTARRSATSRLRIDMPAYDFTVHFVEYWNGYIPFNTSGELPGPNPIAVKSGWEPEGSGSVTPLPFQGARTAWILSGGRLRTDAQSIIVPGGSKPYIRQLVSTIQSPWQWPASRIAHGSVNSLGESENTFGTGAGTDQVDVTGTFGDNVAAYAFGPCAILGVPSDGRRRPVCLLLDNSLGSVAGTDGAPNYGDTNGYAGRGERALAAAGISSINASRASSRLQWQAAGFATTLALTAPYVTSVLIGISENDWSNSRTLVNMQTDLAALVTGFQAFGVQVHVMTSSPKVIATADAYLDGGSAINAGLSAVANSYNAWLRTRPLGIAAVHDVAAALEDPARPGFFKPNNPALTTDGTHYTATGMALAVAAINTNLIQ